MLAAISPNNRSRSNKRENNETRTENRRRNLPGKRNASSLEAQDEMDDLAELSRRIAALF